MFERKLPKHKVYLSKRNLLALLSKLERYEAGDETACAIVKNQSAPPPPRSLFQRFVDRILRRPEPELPPYQQTMGSIMVIAIPDDLMYRDRAAGMMHPKDEANLPKPGKGVVDAGPVF